MQRPSHPPAGTSNFKMNVVDLLCADEIEPIDLTSNYTANDIIEKQEDTSDDEIYNVDEFDYSFLLKKHLESGLFYITSKFKAKYVKIIETKPDFFPVHPEGFACIYKEENVLRPNFTISGSDSSDSIRFRSGRDSTVFFNGSNKKVKRKSGTCNGIKACAYSISACSEKHCGDGPAIGSFTRKERSNDAHTLIEEEFNLARNVFFYAQANYSCKIHTDINDTSEYFLRQRKEPDWIYVSGCAGSSSNTSGFITCKHYENNSEQCKRKCDKLFLPSHLEQVDPRYLHQLIVQAMNGEFPEPCNEAMNRCPPYGIACRKKYCDRRTHEYEAVPLVTIKCNAKYQYFSSLPSDDEKFCIIVGYGEHSHVKPPMQLQNSTTKEAVSTYLNVNPTMTTKQITNKLVKDYNRKATIGTIRKLRSTFVSKRYPFGKNLSGLIKQMDNDVLNCRTDTYVRSITDERERDLTRSTSDQIGIVVIMYDEKLLKMTVDRPRLGCDDTFSVVAKDNENVEWQLCSIVAKSEDIGKVYVPFRALTTRKTIGARKVVFKHLIDKLVSYGLHDPLTAPPHKRITMATDFETTFAIALGKVLMEKFRPGENMGKSFLQYVNMIAFGCDVHAKRIILEKLKINSNEIDYLWAIGTRKVDTQEQVIAALSKMKIEGGKWLSFANWLESNEVAKILWFQHYYKKNWNFVIARYAMWDTNANESINAQLKRSVEMLVTNGNGLSIVELVDLMKDIDKSACQNLEAVGHLQYSSTPLFQKKAKKRKNLERDDKIQIDGKTVNASCPKRKKQK